MLLLLCNTAFQILDTQMLNLIIVLYVMPLFLSHIGTLIVLSRLALLIPYYLFVVCPHQNGN